MDGIRMHSFNEKKVEEKEPIDVYSLIDENEVITALIPRVPSFTFLYSG